MHSVAWLLACSIALTVTSAAAAYPERPLRVILPNAPGSTTDLLGRVVFTRISEQFGKPIVVDNRRRQAQRTHGRSAGLRRGQEALPRRERRARPEHTGSVRAADT